jgi:chromate transporter
MGGGVLRREAGVVREVFVTFLRLGCTSFGGPIAHLAYFRRTLVERLGWIDEAGYARIVAFCTVLPGPTSSQVGMLLGLIRSGPVGALAAWLGFTLPSALLMGGSGFCSPARRQPRRRRGWAACSTASSLPRRPSSHRPYSV